MKSLALVLLLALPVAGGPTYEFEVDKTGDSVVALAEGDFLITSQRGIGGCTIRPLAGNWPQCVTLRLRYGNGSGFSRLEGLGLGTPTWRIQGSLDRSGNMSRDYPGQPDRPPESCDVRVVNQDGLKVILPPGLLQGQEPLTFGWIDAFR